MLSRARALALSFGGRLISQDMRKSRHENLAISTRCRSNARCKERLPKRKNHAALATKRPPRIYQLYAPVPNFSLDIRWQDLAQVELFSPLALELPPPFSLNHHLA